MATLSNSLKALNAHKAELRAKGSGSRKVIPDISPGRSRKEVSPTNMMGFTRDECTTAVENMIASRKRLDEKKRTRALKRKKNKGSIASRRGLYDDNPTHTLVHSSLMLDSKSGARSRGKFDDKTGRFISDVEVKACELQGRLFKQHGVEMSLDDCKAMVIASTPDDVEDQRIAKTGEFRTVDPIYFGDNYVTQGKGRQPGTDVGARNDGKSDVDMPREDFLYHEDFWK